MNILPKKRWHVRTKENIARVRKDEANAAKEEAEKQRRIKLAEQEARTNLLRVKARSKYDGREEAVKKEVKEEVKEDVNLVTSDGHINFFAELQAGLVPSTATNKEHDEELKEEREKYEKQIGYLTYLGQDTVEATGNVSWYNKTPAHAKEQHEKDEEAGLKHKLYNDPVNAYKQFCFSDVKVKPNSSSQSIKRKASLEEERKPAKRSKREKKKRKSKHRKKSRRTSSSSSSDSSDLSDEDSKEKKRQLEKLRAERIRREEEEKKRSQKVLSKMYGMPCEDEEKAKPTSTTQQKYNSQYNPGLARQNYKE